mmetsp:Transcript_1058/g.2977  ORF Transcript_1058/g.2977 Transcript_1058/m.2977 type:complete len:376 (+) Transcript_1058:1640-2767(+)
MRSPVSQSRRKNAEKASFGSLGFSEHRWLQRAWGSIGSTRPMRYTDVVRRCASVSARLPSFRKWPTSAMWTPTSTWFLSLRWSMWIASSRSLAVAGSMVKTLLCRRSWRFFVSASKEALAWATIWSTSSSKSSAKSTSWTSSSCSMSACFSSASRSPALPRHWPFRRPMGNVEVSFQSIIVTGQSLNLSSLPGIFRIFRSVSLICSRIQGMRLSVGSAFRVLSPSRMVQSPADRLWFFASLGWSVHTMTRAWPFLSSMATTLHIWFLPLSWAAARPLAPLLLDLSFSCSLAARGRPNSTSSSESEELSKAGLFGSCSSSSSCSSTLPPRHCSPMPSSSTISTMTTSPWTARLRPCLPLTSRSFTSDPAFAPSGRT